MLTAAVKDPDGQIDLVVPDGADVRDVIEMLSERSPLFDHRACLALMDGERVSLEQGLSDGDRVDLYLMFGGG
jgi:hypothetical protein